VALAHLAHRIAKPIIEGSQLVEVVAREAVESGDGIVEPVLAINCEATGGMSFPAQSGAPCCDSRVGFFGKRQERDRPS
jgi:hypothetical protein